MKIDYGYKKVTSKWWNSLTSDMDNTLKLRSACMHGEEMFTKKSIAI